VLDYLLNDPSIDDTRVAVIGHSRGGKTALWTTALDTRFRMAVSNDAGTGGHAMSRGNDGLYTNKPAPGCTSPTNNGQTHAELNSMFPSWFSTKYRTTAVGSLAVDAHMLIAATAPRPVYVGTSKCDDSDDTEGNVAALIGAARGTYNPWSIHGKTGFVLTVIPGGGANSYWNTTNGFVGYHRRNGTHELLLEDWNHYIAFANARVKYPN
jgi:pimeloyl-ACP methyl ester carboxylesterase